jgi:hypothetical protein
MATIISPTVISVGDLVSSEILDLEDEIELIFRASSRALTFSSQVRVVVEGAHRTGDFRPIHTFLLTDTEVSRYTLSQPPTRTRIKGECLLGRAIFDVVSIEREMPVDPPPELGASPGDVLIVGPGGTVTVLSPPGPGFYLGTHPTTGVLGYYPMPVGASSSRIWNDIPVGGIDGSNDEFLLAAPPNPAQSLQLFKNGILMREGAGNDFTLSGALITYSPGQIPQSGDVHSASYDI